MPRMPYTPDRIEFTKLGPDKRMIIVDKLFKVYCLDCKVEVVSFSGVVKRCAACSKAIAKVRAREASAKARAKRKLLKEKP